MARKKYMFNKEQKTVYKVDITDNISESSSTPMTEEQKKAREEHNARRASRRATNATKNVVTAEDIKNKRYDILAQYHQLNYVAIQAAIKELQLKPKYMVNTYLVITDVSHDDFEKIKEALLKCHFETAKHKQYKVRVAGYKHNAIIKSEKAEKKAPANNANVAAKAKQARKETKRVAFVNRKTKTLADVKTVSHKPAVKDTSSRARKISKRVKKACKYLAKKENSHMSTKVVHMTKKPKNKAVQGALKFAA